MIKRLVGAVQHITRETIRYLYWTTDASTYDPMLKEGVQRVWLDGWMRHDAQDRQPGVPPRTVN